MQNFRSLNAGTWKQTNKRMNEPIEAGTQSINFLKRMFPYRQNWSLKRNFLLYWKLIHSKGEGGMPGGSSFGGDDELKSIAGYTPGGLSRCCIDNNCVESPTTSAHP
uniref:Uncharacterized protein n=1 Tax=Arundo donax TaxID=35708 RepID=A0A0A9EZF4_ARUDO